MRCSNQAAAAAISHRLISYNPIEMRDIAKELQKNNVAHIFRHVYALCDINEINLETRID